MKYLIAIPLLLLYHASHGQNVSEHTVDYKGNKFYHLTVDTNQNILIFLHGGVNNPYFQDTSKIPTLNYLLEDNKFFINNALRSGFDLLIPIKNDSLNWLNKHDYCFEKISSYLRTTKKYSNKYVSGFSDGGTGAYKMFYDNKDYFTGLMVFNGYPQHQNFNKKVDYKNVTDKKIIFYSTFQDKVIPYEFLLTEYAKQKKYNTNTFLRVVKGAHTFAAYDSMAILDCFKILTSKISNSKNDNTHGFIVNDQLIEFYVFRKMIVRKYAYARDIYEENRRQSKLVNKK